ncbi:hypothetical protein TPA0910_31860 [Streptomyces hygroscopicus subsp. sporocinereus]|uniref:Uncharacterized protein n=1 Tax=Streptomyces hygroscopicus TaxID=1912 RepID=A0ABQ3TZL1_STRHY|nr:hypothetical protein TPA0910_31860 [Streptomyces hygroscopicus]
MAGWLRAVRLRPGATARPSAPVPPHSSTTLRPPANTVTAAPSSGNSSKFRVNASATPPNPSSAHPLYRSTIVPAPHASAVHDRVTLDRGPPPPRPVYPPAGAVGAASCL